MAQTHPSDLHRREQRCFETCAGICRETLTLLILTAFKKFNSNKNAFERQINVLGGSKILFYAQLYFLMNGKIINNL